MSICIIYTVHKKNVQIRWKNIWTVFYENNRNLIDGMISLSKILSIFSYLAILSLEILIQRIWKKK